MLLVIYSMVSSCAQRMMTVKVNRIQKLETWNNVKYE